MTMRSRSGQGGLVYSTDHGRMCPDCRLPMEECQCKAQAAAALAKPAKLRVALETKGRGGKAVTVVRGLALAPEPLAALGKQLRTVCGAGGTARDGVLEIQGDHCAKVLEWLRAQGMQV